MPSPDQFAAAAHALAAGALVVFPTETVYGLGANASDDVALRRVFQTKGRPSDHPLIVHLATPADLDHWSASTPPSAVALAEAFWPGPLTLLVPRARHVLDTVTGGRPTVGLRVPSHPVAHAFLARFAEIVPHGGVAAPSANRFGAVSPTEAVHAKAELLPFLHDGDLIIDGGASTVGLESTIVDCSVNPPMILRHGAVTAEMLGVVTDLQDAAGPSRAPGMLASHYAPRCAVIAVADRSHADRVAVEAVGPVEVLDYGIDVDAMAHGLYASFRAADARGVQSLIVVLPPESGLGRAIRDRVTKASADRPVPN